VRQAGGKRKGLVRWAHRERGTEREPSKQPGKQREERTRAIKTWFGLEAAARKRDLKR